jgi:hypothetical protein
MLEDLNQSSRQDAARGPVISIHQVLEGPPHEGDLGKGLLFRTNRGDLSAILHEASEAHLGVIWASGARGGFAGPAGGIYNRMAETFKNRRITSLRLNYRQPNDFLECVLDLQAGIDYFQNSGYDPVALVGHSFGGAVVIAAGAISPHVRGVVSLSPQTYGAHMAGLLSPRPLLVVHGKSDTRLPYTCGVQIYNWAKKPKQLVLYDGTEHRLEECPAELETFRGDGIPAPLTSDGGRTTIDERE